MTAVVVAAADADVSPRGTGEAGPAWYTRGSSAASPPPQTLYAARHGSTSFPLVDERFPSCAAGDGSSASGPDGGNHPASSPVRQANGKHGRGYLAPGAPSSAPHRHPGFVLGYVIEGEFRFQIAGEPERTIRAGETFYEPPGAQHLVSASAIADRPARVLAIVIAESGHPITEPL